MHIIIWCVLGLALLVSAHAARFDQGPQTFQEDFARAPVFRQKYETKDVLLYLTPQQVRALEAGGAFVRPKINDDEVESPVEQQGEIEEEEEGEDEEKEQEGGETANENIEQEQDNNEDTQARQPVLESELEEIFRILNEQILENAKKSQQDFVPQIESQNNEERESDQENDQENEQEDSQESEQENDQENFQESEQEDKIEEVQNDEQELQVDDEAKELENIRQIPPRFGLYQTQRGEKYFAPSVLLKQRQQAKQSFERPLPYIRKSVRLQQEGNKKIQKKRQDNKQAQKQNKEKIIPVEEPPQEEDQRNSEAEIAQEKLTALLTPILNNDNIVQSIAQHRGKLIQNEQQLQTTLQEIKDKPQHNNQKYFIEIENLRANLEKQNALARAEVLAKTRPFLNKGEAAAKNVRVRNNKDISSAPVKTAAPKVKAPKPAEAAKPVSVPVIKSSRIAVKESVPGEIEKAIPTALPKQAYFTVNRPYYLERIIPTKNSKDSKVSVRKPGELTIIRHVWEH